MYSATIPDRLHHLDIGLFKYQLEYSRQFLKTYVGQEAVNEMDKRLSLIPFFSNLKIFLGES